MKAMKLNTYKNYRICPVCGEEFPLIREFFKRLRTPQGKEGFHHICKKCEDELRRNKERQGKLLLCHCCEEYKHESEFSLKGGSDPIRNNRRTICKSCYTSKQRELHLNLDDDKKLKKCLNSRFLGARDRAKRNKIDFNLTLEYIEELWNNQHGLCALSGIKMTYDFQKGRTPTNLSIDRIDSNKGYTIGNIQLVCMACNQIKSDLSNEEMYNFCKMIVKQYESKNKKSSEAA